MKKKIGILLFWVMLLCSGCGWNDDEPIQDDFNEPSASPEIVSNIPTSAGSQVPYWAQGTQTKGNLYQGLNLDGIGEADDEVYVSMYEYGDKYKEVIALRVHLGTGETLVEIYPQFDYQDYSFMAGRIFSEDRDAVILGVQSGNSNYSATNIWVLKVSPADPVKHIFAEMWVALDTTAQPNGMSLDILSGNGSSWGLDSSDGSTLMTRDPEVVDIEGSPLQGLKVTIFDPHEGADKELESVIYWKDGLWNDGNRTYIGKWEFLGEWTPKAE